MYFKPRTAGREIEFEREIRILCRAKELGLNRGQIRLPDLLGIAVSDEKGVTTIGMLMTLIISPKMGTHLLSEQFWSQHELHHLWEEQVIATVQQLHANQIVWGDVNPCNVVIDKDLNAWVIDFGGMNNPEFVDDDKAETMEDSMGGMAKSATDLRLLTRIITGSGMQTKDFSESLQGFRIGFVDPRKWRLPDIYCPLSIELRDELDEKYNEIMAIFEKHGAKIVANVSLPDTDDLTIDGESVIHTIAFAEFRSCFRNFATALTSPIQSLDELIEYNEQHPQETMPPRKNTAHGKLLANNA
ncbi:hypothetical protein MBLNU459_g3930t1 [Dothideomycetes sp. NU459]